MNYPELYYPEYFINIVDTKPIIIKPTKPSKPHMPFKPEEVEGNSGCLLVPVLCIILLFVLDAKLINTQIVLGMIVLSLLSFFMYKTGVWDKKKHSEDLEKYHSEKLTYNNKLRTFDRDVDIYKNKLELYKASLRDAMSEENLDILRQSLYDSRNELDNPVFLDCEVGENIREGISENFFYEILLNLNNIQILRNKKIAVGTSFYYPDFILIDLSKGFVFDIEIDEPYEALEGTPIHYMEDIYGLKNSVDSQRNDFFNKKGCFVLRFAEEQIINAPNECIEYVKRSIEECGQFSLNAVEMNYKVDKWTVKISHQLAFKQFRNSYLNNAGIRLI